MAGIEAGVGFSGELSYRMVQSLAISLAPAPTLQCLISLLQDTLSISISTAPVPELQLKIQVPGDP